MLVVYGGKCGGLFGCGFLGCEVFSLLFALQRTYMMVPSIWCRGSREGMCLWCMERNQEPHTWLPSLLLSPSHPPPPLRLLLSLVSFPVYRHH